MKRILLALPLTLLPIVADAQSAIETGIRPLYLIDRMAEGPLKTKLQSCIGKPVKRTDFSIGHRGAPMQFPEHSVESNIAAARQGAGILECDVTFTKDKELVCRHAQNDLHTTTNILTTKLAGTCKRPFSPASVLKPATAECRTSELTLAEFRTLTPKMAAANKKATNLASYMNATADWRTDLYAAEATTLMTHADSIQLFKSLGTKFTPELKTPSVKMPFDGFTKEDYAQKLINEYKAAGIPPSDVWVQSFNLYDVLYWIKAEPEFGKQAIYIDNQYKDYGFNHMDPATYRHNMSDLKAQGVNIISPPMWILVTLENGKIVPSAYATEAKAAGLKLFTWTLERSGPLVGKGGWHYQSITDATSTDGIMYELVDVLAQDVGVEGIFADWPATVSFYASCMGLK